MPDLTLVMPTYLNSGMIARQYEGWAAWPEELKERLAIILVDDGSPEPAADVLRPEGLPALSIYRVLVDIPWHQHGGKNLGAYVAEPGWLLLTDMDHVLEPAAAEKLLAKLALIDERRIYTLDRIEADTRLPTKDRNGNPKPHPNSFVMTRATYWRIGGYDEEYTGYGTDSLYRERAFRVARKGHLDVPLVRYWRDLVPDASTNGLGRKDSAHSCDKAAITQRKTAEGRMNEIRILDFPWERVL